jgi:signal recognition particle receptor subunit beta
MALVNHATKEINVKIVYYGAEMAGKGTSLRYVHDRIRPSLRSELKSIPVSGSPLLFFDFSPFERPVFGEYRIRFHLYTLQGVVANPAAWKMTLKGADGLVIVVDATPGKYLAAQQALAHLRDFLDSYGVGLDDVPAVLQLNKADLSRQLVAEAVARGLGVTGIPTFPTTACTGAGVLEALSALSPLVMGRIGERDDLCRPCPPGGGAAPETTARKSAPESGVGGREGDEWQEPRESAPFQTTVEEEPSPGAGQVAVSEEGVRVEAGTVIIPLAVTSPQGVQRLTVTVMVAPA